MVKSVPKKQAYYLEKNEDKLPKFYKKDLGIYWDWCDGILIDLQTLKPVPVDTRDLEPKLVSIMGNTMQTAMFEGKMARILITKMKRELKDYFVREFKKDPLPVIKTFPIILEMKFYIDLSNSAKDEDGIRFFYDKVFRDCIQQMIYMPGTKYAKKGALVANPHGIIPNDNIQYITGSNFRVFQVPEGHEPYLRVSFYNYESPLEREMDFRDIPYTTPDPEKMDIVSKMCEKLVVSKFERAGKRLYKLDGNLVEEYREQYLKDYEFYFKILTG